MMTDFYKDSDDIESLNLSEISDVDPNEIEKIVKSAGELDKKYFGIGLSKSLEDKEKGTSSKTSADLRELDISSDENEGVKVKGPLSKPKNLVNLPLAKEVPIGHELKVQNETELKTEKRTRGSADWLGLKDSPVKQSSFDADDYMRLKTTTPVGTKPESSTFSDRNISSSPAATRNISGSTRRNEFDKQSPDKRNITSPSGSPSAMSLSQKAEQINKNKGKLISELFGEAKLAGEESFKIGVGSENISDRGDDQLKAASYTPSASAGVGRRLERKKETSAPRTSSGLDDDFDWLLGSRPTTARVKTPQNEPTSKSSFQPQSSLSTAPPVPQVRSSTPRAAPRESKMPDWLEGILPDTSKKEESSKGVTSDLDLPIQPKQLPDWLNGTKQTAPSLAPDKEKDVPKPETAPEVQEPSTNQEANIVNAIQLEVLPSVQLSNDGNTIVKQLASIKKELGNALEKRNQNLQVYLQVLMLEAQRVLNVPKVASTDVDLSNESINDKTEKEQTKTDKKDETIKKQEDLLHDFEINVSRLELQNSQLEMKIDNLKLTHAMEIETLKKNHGFEITSWESRLERMKTSFDETVEEYKAKISKLKENEETLIAEHKERIAKLEEERRSDLEKLGEFHRIALEHAATITVPVPNVGQVIRLPLKPTNRPKDEVELSERESALLEKERQIEVLKAVVETEKRELDEALEIEKIRREERERESQRYATEKRLREEARQAEAKREREQLDAVALQIKLMREEALKEQGELAKEKLELAAERARLEATYSIQGRVESSLPPLDIMQARAEVEAALDIARQAKEAAEQERRRQAEMRQSVEQITWEQKEMDLRLENREKHLKSMLMNAEKLRSEGLSALDEAKAMKQEFEEHQKDIKEQLKQIETKERVLAKERLEIAKEKVELERRRAQLEIILPDLNPAEELSLNPPKVYVDPKAVITRLKAEKDLMSYMTTKKF